LCHVWVFGTGLLATLLLSWGALAVELAVRRKRLAFLGLGALILLGAAVSVLANPIANLLVFHKVAARNADHMISDMRTRYPVGQDAREVITTYGPPRRVRHAGSSEVWTYDPNPWWLMGWAQIEIEVASSKIQGHWLED